MAEAYKPEYKDVTVDQLREKLSTDITRICPTDGINGGFALTGFIDVEDIIKIKCSPWDEKTLFLEKKLPFSIVVFSLDTQKEKDKGDK
jgi:hypothetical protein